MRFGQHLLQTHENPIECLTAGVLLLISTISLTIPLRAAQHGLPSTMPFGKPQIGGLFK